MGNYQVRFRGRGRGQSHWEPSPLPDEIDADGIFFGLADLGFGCPELGSFALAELEAVRLPFGLTIERDLHFTPRHQLSAYAEAARRAGSIVLGEQRLRRAAERLSGRG
ncbi:MAG: DUF2958 domain-containing protein [Sphingopyxis granuli]